MWNILGDANALWLGVVHERCFKGSKRLPDRNVDDVYCDLPDLFASDRRACGELSVGTWSGVVLPGVRKRHVHCLSPAISWDLEVDSYKPRCKQSTSTNSDAKANGRRCRELAVAKGRSEEPISSQASVALVHWKRA